MAPEQLRGEEVDVRSDIWGAGCLLYEMATGGRPFLQTRVRALAESIFHDEPIWPRCSLPSELERIVLRCLEKERKYRYQSAEELGVELGRMHVDKIATGNYRTQAFAGT
jgi:serine/threonine-protein kinase